MKRWLLLQLADSALPTGGFAHSGGLEASVALGLCDGAPGLERFLEEAIWQCAGASLPWVAAAHADPAGAGRLDAECDASIPGHVANRASRVQGQSFLRAAAAAFPDPVTALLERATVEEWRCHLGPTFGATLALLGATRDEARRLFLFQATRGVASAAVRLGVVGPFEAQRLLARLHTTAEHALDATCDRAAEDAAVTSPLVELAQTCQDRLYSRLFQS